MWKFPSPHRPPQDDCNESGSDEELVYDPKCGMSKEEFEWRCTQYKTVCQRMPHVLDELRTHSQKMRQYFLADPEALKKWDEYADDVQHAFASNLQHSISSPVRLPDSVLYEHLMKRKTRSQSLVGMLFGGLKMMKQPTKMVVGAGT
ncbi:hypothetical protein QOZ80_2AG0147250 [Eleusine coracana subsp. coracana]|nr:hypothetical protein QOZ80_2AG0147250 [Eleusine coracana subsp. coracana]